MQRSDIFRQYITINYTCIGKLIYYDYWIPIKEEYTAYKYKKKNYIYVYSISVNAK